MFMPTEKQKMSFENSGLILGARSIFRTGKICPVLTNPQATQPTLRL
jgi:hypothetical protein